MKLFTKDWSTLYVVDNMLCMQLYGVGYMSIRPMGHIFICFNFILLECL